MLNNILIVYSGHQDEIISCLYDEIYSANTSFLRLDDTSNVNFVLSDALFFEEKIFASLTIDGLSRQQSNNRRQKYKLINNLRSKVIITDSGMNINFKSRLKKNIKSDVIEILDSKKI